MFLFVLLITDFRFVALFSGTVFLVTYGKQSPLGNLNDYSKNCKARHSWKAAFFI